MSVARRLFFALWPDDATRQALFHWQTHNLPHDLRWQHRADLHLTLHFLGTVDPGRIDDPAFTGRRSVRQRLCAGARPDRSLAEAAGVVGRIDLAAG